MPAKFNLLPKDSAANKDVVRATKALKVISMVIIVIASIGGMAGASALYYYNNLLNKEKDRHQSLKSTVNNLENTEQSLVLIKDRAEKLSEIVGNRQSANIFLKQKQVVDDLPENMSFSATTIFPAETRLDVLSTSSRSMVSMFEDLNTREDLQTVVIKQISFNPSLGYTVSLFVQ